MNRAADVALASVGLALDEPAARRRRARRQARGRRPGPLPPAPRGQGRRRVRAAQAADDGGRGGEDRRRLRGRPGRPADHAHRPAPPAALDRRAAPALERRPRRHEPDRAAADARVPGRALRRSASGGGSRSSRGSPAGLRSTAAHRSPGRTGSSWTSGTSSTARRRSTSRSSRARRWPCSAARTRAPRAAGAPAASVCVLDHRPLHLRRTAGRHRLRLPPCRRAHGCRRRRPARACALPRARARDRAARRRPRLPPCAAGARPRARRHGSSIPLADLDHLLLAERRTELDGALVLLPAPEVVRRTEDKYEAHLFFEAARHPLAGELAARRAAGRAAVPGARQAPARLRLAAHLPRRRIARSSTSTFAARLPTRSSSRSASARSSRSTSSATSRAAASARSRGR